MLKGSHDKFECYIECMIAPESAAKKKPEGTKHRASGLVLRHQRLDSTNELSAKHNRNSAKGPDLSATTVHYQNEKGSLISWARTQQTTHALRACSATHLAHVSYLDDARPMEAGRFRSRRLAQRLGRRCSLSVHSPPS